MVLLYLTFVPENHSITVFPCEGRPIRNITMVRIAVSGEVYPCTTHTVCKDFRLFPTYGRSLGHDDIVKNERQFGTIVGHGESSFKRGIPCKHIVINRCAVLVGFQAGGFKSRGTQHCFDIKHICNRTLRICLFESLYNSFRMITEPLFQPFGAKCLN